MPTVRWLLGLVINPGWAPLSVVLVHIALAERGLTDRFDHHLHFSGGAAIAFFFHGMFGKLTTRVSIGSKLVHYLLAFTSACTMAVFWEFAEFSSDQFRHTAIQQSLTETMLDLAFGVAGASVSLAIVEIAKRIRHGVVPKRRTHKRERSGETL